MNGAKVIHSRQRRRLTNSLV